MAFRKKATLPPRASRSQDDNGDGNSVRKAVELSCADLR